MPDGHLTILYPQSQSETQVKAPMRTTKAPIVDVIGSVMRNMSASIITSSVACSSSE